MRDDLINRAAVMESLTKEYNRRWTEGSSGLQLAWIEKAVNDTPTAEKTGHWIEKYNETDEPLFRRRWYCSSCGEWQTYGRPKYCPMCGARMKGAEA